jgi:S-adenosylmethionine:tRNA ribosyltransferase-isomerase
VWEALVRPGGKLKPGRRVVISRELAVDILDSVPGGGRLVRLDTHLTTAEALELYGHTPLPPYIDREDEALDRDRYQTVYAREAGSVAAPTAGLHFTPGILEELEARGVRRAAVVLHVGIGTFRPVEVEDPAEHEMHAEVYHVPPETARAVADTRSRGGRVWAVGTTVVRTLESAAMGQGRVRAGSGSTRLFIRPPYHPRVVDGLLTNFHLPRSTLLMLVAAFGGYEPVMAAYRAAVDEGYRFYSYGDAMAVLPRDPRLSGATGDGARPAAAGEGAAPTEEAGEGSSHLSTEEAVSRTGPPPDLSVPWGSHPLQVGDLRLPEGPGPHPVAVLLHGGCWRSVADRHYLEPLAAELNALGWATWNVGYRPADGPDGAWPALLDDVAAGVDHLRRLSLRGAGAGSAGEPGRSGGESALLGADLDLRRVVAVGHSAGGHLALWLATRRDPEMLPIRGVVALAGVADLEAFAELEEAGCRGAVEELLGGPPDRHPDRVRRASPLHHLPLDVPQLLVVGGDDPDVPPAHVAAWARVAREAGDPVRMLRLPGAGHFEPVRPEWEGWAPVRRRLRAFLGRVGAT